jgi:hypothetical protein
VIAGFEANVQLGPTCSFARRRQGYDLGVRRAGTLMMPHTDDASVEHDERADGRVRKRRA